MKLAIAGVGGLVCEALLEELAKSGVRPDSLILLAESDDEEVNPIYDGRSQAVQPVADFDFAGADVVIFVDEPRLAENFLEKALESGSDVVDATGWSASLGMGELWGSSHIDCSRSDDTGPRHWVCPNPLATVLVDALRPVLRLTGIASADVMVCQPVSVAGRSGVESLASEAARLLNGQPLETNNQFGQQIAFNLLPETGEGASAVQGEIQQLLGAADLPLNLSSAVVPVFYGLTMAIHLRCEQVVAIEELEREMADAGLVVASEGESISPVLNAREPVVTVASLKVAGSDSRILSFWIVADNIRKGAALNIIPIVEILKKCST